MSETPEQSDQPNRKPRSRRETPSASVNLEELGELITLMRDNGLSELELEREDFRVRLRRDSVGPTAPPPLHFELASQPGAHMTHPSACTRITQLLTRRDCRFAHGLAQLRRQHCRGRFLHQLLVSTLNGTLALAQVDTLAKLIREHLDLDVTRLLDVSLDVDAAVVERRGSFS